MVTRPTPVTWLSFWASTVSARSLTFSSGSVSEVICKRENRRVGGVDLVVGRRVRHVLWQNAAGGVDRRLDVLRRGVDVAVEIELQNDG